MFFEIRPWDRPRPRLHPPLPDGTFVWNGRTFEFRARHSLTFLREVERGDEWLFAVDPSFDGEPSAALAKGQVARYVLLPYRAQTWRREFPLFFRADGTGWLRESWNREDIRFEHDLSLHEWLEAPASALFPFASELFRRDLAPKLEALGWPKGRDVPLDFAGGSQSELMTIVRHTLALEEAVENSGKLIRVTFESESPFYRAGCFTVQAESGEVETWFDETSGERVRLPWKEPTLRLSNRFWTLCDLAVDAVTPLGHYFDYHHQGVGRLSESPQPRVFSLQFIAGKLPAPDTARAELGRWLSAVGGAPDALEETLICDFEPRNRD